MPGNAVRKALDKEKGGKYADEVEPPASSFANEFLMFLPSKESSLRTSTMPNFS